MGRGRIASSDAIRVRESAASVREPGDASSQIAGVQIKRVHVGFSSESGASSASATVRIGIRGRHRSGPHGDSVGLAVGQISRGWSAQIKQPSDHGTQHQRQCPQRRQQPPHALQPPQRQPRQPQPRQPPQRPTQAVCCKPAVPLSLSNRWNVARLTSPISSSPRTNWCPVPGKLLSDCGTSAAGSVEAKALPISENPSPAAPSVAAAAALVAPFPLAACFLRAMDASLGTFRFQVDVRVCPYRLRMRSGAGRSFRERL